MEIIKREIAREVEPKNGKIGVRVSVVQFKDGNYEIAVLTKQHAFDKWEIDYSVFPDVFTAETSMEVYGIIQYIIAPTYYEEFGVSITF